MKVQSLILVAALVAGFQASAMPAFEGKYNCSAPGNATVVPVEFQIKEDKLFINGLDAGVAKDGLPCTNDTQAVTQDGVSYTVATTCTDKALTLNLGMVAPSIDTDLKMFIGVTLVSATQVDMNFTVAGKSQGTAINEAALINCVK